MVAKAMVDSMLTEMACSRRKIMISMIGCKMEAPGARKITVAVFCPKVDKVAGSASSGCSK